MRVEYEQDILSESHKESIKILHYSFKKKIRNLNRKKKTKKYNQNEPSQVHE